MWGGSNSSLQSSTDNVPVAKASAQTVRQVRSPKVPKGRGLEFGSMVNICECPTNVVISDKLKAQVSGLSQKAKQWEQEVEAFLSWANNTVGGEDRPNLSLSQKWNVVSP